MSEEILFQEKQSKKPIWIWLIIGTVSVFFMFTFISQIFFNRPVGDQPSSNGILILNFVLLVALIYLLIALSLNVKITKETIYYKFKPFHLKWQSIKKEEIDKIYVREYKPVLEYGGWGVKSKKNGKGFSFTMRGNKGIQIDLKSGKNILIGTQKLVAAEKVIEYFK
jgi:hypothetical protein